MTFVNGFDCSEIGLHEHGSKYVEQACSKSPFPGMEIMAKCIPVVAAAP